MFQLGNQELTQANQLIKEGKFEDSIRILKDFEEKRNKTLQDIVLCHLLKCRIFLEQALYEKVVKFTEQTYKESLGLEKNILSVDALLIMANGLLNINKFELADKKVKQGEDVLKTLTNELPINKNQREAYIFYLKGTILDPFLNPKGDLDLALKYYNDGLSLAESIGDIGRTCACLLQIAWDLSISRGEFDLPLEYAERALTLAKEANYKFYISRSLVLKALFYHEKGWVSRSIPLYEQSLAIAKKLKNNRLISANLNNLSDAYRMKGELDCALEHILQCLDHYSEAGNLRRVAMFYDSLIRILIEKGDFEQAQQNFNHLEQINQELKDNLINLIYLYNKAMFLKESPRISNRGKAEEILKQILEDENIFWELKERVLLTLCELLLLELQLTGNLEVLVEVEFLIARLLDNAEKSHSYWILGEIYLLQAKLALISLNLKEARRLLTQGQKIANKHGLELLAIKISIEHDNLLQKLVIWEKLKDSESPLSDRLKLANLDEQIKIMIQKHRNEIPEIVEENPVMILVISEGGVLTFSKLFTETLILQEDLISSFLATFNSFSSEFFSEGLDRATFGQFNLLIKPISTFLVCYLFKGQSYSAQRKIQHFVENIEKNKNLLEEFKNYYQTNQIIKLEDIPALNSLIMDIFIEKRI